MRLPRAGLLTLGALLVGVTLSYAATRTVLPTDDLAAIAAAAQPGDTLTLAPGVHRARVVLTQQATAAQPLTLQGTRDQTTGAWLSVIDGSDPVTAPWTLAPSMGPGIWRAQLPYEPYSMQVDTPMCNPVLPDACSKTIWRIGSDAMYMRGLFAPGQEHYQLSGPIQLARAADAQTRFYSQQSIPVPFWDGIEALFGHYNGYVYVKFRNGDDPNAKTLTISPGPAGQFTRPSTGAAVTLNGAQYVIVQDLRLRGARNGVLLQNNASLNTIRRNHITNGQARVRLETGAHHNRIEQNMLLTNHLAGWPGGARADSLDYATMDRVSYWNVYYVNKFTVGDGGSDDRGVWLWQAGPGNVITYNAISQGSIGIALLEGADSTEVSYNNLYHLYAEGILAGYATMNVNIHHNLFDDNGIALRIQDLDRSTIAIYVHHNVVVQPYGEEVFLHSPNDVSSSGALIAWYYNTWAAPQRSQQAQAGDRVSAMTVSSRIVKAPLVQLHNNSLGAMRVDGMEKLTVTNNLLPTTYNRPGNIPVTFPVWTDTPPPLTVPPEGVNQALDLTSKNWPGTSSAMRDIGALQTGEVMWPVGPAAWVPPVTPPVIPPTGLPMVITLPPGAKTLRIE